MKTMLRVFAIFAVIASTGAYVEEYSKGAEEGYQLLTKGKNHPAKIINEVNGLQFRKAPEIITGDTILFETNSISYHGLTTSDEECGYFEGISVGTPMPFCKITHFGFRVTGTISEKVRHPDVKNFYGISTETLFGSSASAPLLSEFNSHDNAEKTYLEIILLFKHKFPKKPPTGLILVVPVFEIPAALAAESQGTLREWAKKEAGVGVSSPITPNQLQQIHNLKEITIPNLKWLTEVVAYDIRCINYKSGMEMHASRPLVLSDDVIEGIMKLAKKFLKVNKTQNETPTFSKLFFAEISRQVSNVPLEYCETCSV